MTSNILDPKWKYTPAASTDIRKTIRKEQARIAALKAALKSTLEPTNVRKIEVVRR